MSKSFNEEVVEKVQSEIGTVLRVRLPEVRKAVDYKAYKSFTDTLRTLISMYNESFRFGDILSEDDISFHKIVVSDLENEINDVFGLVKNNADARAYRDWLMSYERLVLLRGDINFTLTKRHNMGYERKE